MKLLKLVALAGATLQLNTMAYSQSVNPKEMTCSVDVNSPNGLSCISNDSINKEKLVESTTSATNVFIGRNLINGDGTQMGQFSMNAVPDTSGSLLTPVLAPIQNIKDSKKQGIDNEAYAKAMATGKYSKGELDPKSSCGSMKKHKSMSKENEKNKQDM